MYTCSVCNKPALLIEGEIVRACEHVDAAVHANLEAAVYGESSMNQGGPEHAGIQ